MISLCQVLFVLCLMLSSTIQHSSEQQLWLNKGTKRFCKKNRELLVFPGIAVRATTFCLSFCQFLNQEECTTLIVKMRNIHMLKEKMIENFINVFMLLPLAFCQRYFVRETDVIHGFSHWLWNSWIPLLIFHFPCWFDPKSNQDTSRKH